MQQFKDYEAQQMALSKKPDADLMKCANCDCSWLEPVRAARFDKNIVSGIGQQPPALVDFALLRCVRCNELHEPPVNRMFSHQEAKVYDEMLDELQAPKEKWGGRHASKTESDKESEDKTDD